jgi:hypothetical protein
MRDSIVGLMPSISARSPMPIGPIRTTVPSTHTWERVRPSVGTWRSIERAIRARAPTQPPNLLFVVTRRHDTRQYFVGLFGTGKAAAERLYLHWSSREDLLVGLLVRDFLATIDAVGELTGRSTSRRTRCRRCCGLPERDHHPAGVGHGGGGRPGQRDRRGHDRAARTGNPDPAGYRATADAALAMAENKRAWVLESLATLSGKSR